MLDIKKSGIKTEFCCLYLSTVNSEYKKLMKGKTTQNKAENHTPAIAIKPTVETNQLCGCG